MDNGILTMVEPEEVEMLVSPPNLALGNKMQRSASFRKLQNRVKSYSNILWHPEIATKFDLMMTTDGKITPLCREYSNSRAHPKTRALAAIAAGTIIAQIFVCVVTRSTNAEVQHNDMMMWTNVQMTWDMRWHLRYGSSVFMRSQNNCEQLRETENKACTCIDLYSRQAHHSVYTNSDQLACFTQAHPRNTLISSKWKFRILRYSLEDLLTSAISSTFCGTGIFTSAPVLHISIQYQISPAEASAHRRRFPTTLYSSWIHSMTSLHKYSRISLHWTEDNKRRIPGLIKQSDSPCLFQSTCCVWLNSRIPLVCSSLCDQSW